MGRDGGPSSGLPCSLAGGRLRVGVVGVIARRSGRWARFSIGYVRGGSCRENILLPAIVAGVEVDGW